MSKWLIAIVGTTVSLTDDEKLNMKKKITSILLKPYPPNTVIISGGAKGVDTIALEIAKDMGFETQQYKPEKEKWKYYKKRNLQIAKDCDELYCFSVSVKKVKCYHHNPPQNHEKTAGCWTAIKALELEKSCQLVIIK